MIQLTSAQERAIASVRRKSRAEVFASRLERVVASAAGPGSSPRAIRDAVRQRGRVALHFHPDRLQVNEEIVVDGLLRTGRYRSQFETGISNGSLSAFPGGSRDLWEQTLFGGAYADADVSERPTYGALHLVGHADGPSPRFGSCYLVLRAEVSERSTYSWGDSYAQPRKLGTFDALDAVLVAWLEQVESTGKALGHAKDLRTLLAELASDGWAMPEPERGTQGRVLDDYVEVQVHGDVLLERDVERLVVDPAFDGTPIGDRLLEIAARHGFPLQRHPGFLMGVEQVPEDFRGPRMPALARRVSHAFARMPGTFDAAAIGRAAGELFHQPWRWADWDGEAETLQHLKQLWHVLVRFGDPACSRG